MVKQLGGWGNMGVLYLMGRLQAWVPHEGTWTKRRSVHGLEQAAHGPRTMGESAKGPAGVAGFLETLLHPQLLPPAVKRYLFI